MKCYGTAFSGRPAGPFQRTENLCIERLADRLDNISISFTTDEKGSTTTTNLGHLLKDLYLANESLRLRVAALEQRKEYAQGRVRSATAVGPLRNVTAENRTAKGIGLDMSALHRFADRAKKLVYDMGFTDGFRAGRATKREI